jgi:hypothetical protein
MFTEGNQIQNLNYVCENLSDSILYNFGSASGSGTLINYGSGSAQVRN